MSNKNTPVLEKVRALLARAEHPNTPAPEADLALMQANRLMTRHAIEEAAVRAAQSSSERRKPVVEKWHWAESYTEFGPHLRSMLSTIADYNRCRVVVGLSAPYDVTVVGMKEDVDWCQMLYTNCYLTFMSRLDPSWDKNSTDDENVYKLKVAGRKWEDIWILMAAHRDIDVHYDYSHRAGRKPAVPYAAQYDDNLDPETYYRDLGMPCEPSSRGYQWLFRSYRRYAKMVGDTNPVETQRHDAYREAFAQGFSDEIQSRLYRMHAESEEEIASSGSELVLHDSKEDVNALFFAEFPQFHPDEINRKAMERAEISERNKRMEREKREEFLAAMTPSARADFLEKEQRKAQRKYDAAQRYWAREDRKSYEHSGAKNGRSAAKTVQLTRSTKVDSNNKKGLDS